MVVDLSRLSIYVRPGPTDMRKQISGLAVIVEEWSSPDFVGTRTASDPTVFRGT
jgi:hypothetical protein